MPIKLTIKIISYSIRQNNLIHRTFEKEYVCKKINLTDIESNERSAPDNLSSNMGSEDN